MSEEKLKVIPSFWQSNNDAACYMTEFATIFDLLGLKLIKEIRLLITYDIERNYALTFAYPEDMRTLPFQVRTINDLLAWQKENKQTIGEFDLILENETHLQSYYGGDIIATHLPIGLLQDIHQKMKHSFQDFQLYQVNSNMSWKKTGTTIHLISSFLESNEEVFFEITD
jgi:hypothetical protein